MVDETSDSQTHRNKAHALAQLAARQHGVFTPTQAGVNASTLRTRVQYGRLFRVYRGVYSLAPPELLTRRGRYMAAVLACGPGAVLSHRSAADLRGLRRTDRARIDVTVPGDIRAPAGVDLHRSRTLAPQDTTTVDGIPTTTISRTLLDLAGLVRPRALERALDQAQIEGVYNPRALHDQIARNRTRPEAAVLRRTIADHEPGTTPTESEFEERMLSICREAGVPPPTINLLIPLPDGEPIRADFAWADRRLIIETDGERFHNPERAFQRDRERDQRLIVAGWRVVRITWRQLTRDRARIVRLLRDLLRP